MKSQFKKVAATALALSMCAPTAAFATASGGINSTTSGSFDTSFDVYSPALHISVPLKADIEVNPMADSANTGVKQFSVASNSIDIINASVDTEADTAIPVNVTVNASITKAGQDVVVEYNSFTADPTSVKKRINLNLTQASTAATLDEGSRAALTGDQNKLLDLSTVPVDTAAVYPATNPANQATVTKYGSLLSVDIGVPTLDASVTSFTADPSKVKPTVGSFAVTGVANTNADWKAEDVQVAITYNVKASQALSITTPKIATAPTFTAGTGAADVVITIPSVGESKVQAIGLHKDGDYGDFAWGTDDYKVEYVANGSATDAKITIPKDDAVLVAYATTAAYNGQAQDLMIALSDGRIVTSTLTCSSTAAP